jgi:hypothetical protein
MAGYFGVGISSCDWCPSDKSFPGLARYFTMAFYTLEEDVVLRIASTAH